MTITKRIGCAVTWRMAAIKASASAGEPNASITTTPWDVTTKPALAMKLRFAGDPKAASPCTNQALSETCCSGKGSAALARVPAPDQHKATHRARRQWAMRASWLRVSAPIRA